MTTSCYCIKSKAKTHTQKRSRVSMGTAVKYMKAELSVSTKYGELTLKKPR